MEKDLEHIYHLASLINENSNDWNMYIYMCEYENIKEKYHDWYEDELLELHDKLFDKLTERQKSYFGYSTSEDHYFIMRPGTDKLFYFRNYLFGTKCLVFKKRYYQKKLEENNFEESDLYPVSRHYYLWHNLSLEKLKQFINNVKTDKSPPFYKYFLEKITKRIEYNQE